MIGAILSARFEPASSASCQLHVSSETFLSARLSTKLAQKQRVQLVKRLLPFDESRSRADCLARCYV